MELHVFISVACSLGQISFASQGNASFVFSFIYSYMFMSVVKMSILLPGENPESTNQESESKTTKEETDQSESTDKSNSKNDKLSDSPPKCSDKPPLPSKPVLPKPVILPKPDKPMQFG